MSHMTYALSCRLKHLCAFLLLAAGFFMPVSAETVPSQSGAWLCGAANFGSTHTTDPQACFGFLVSTPYASSRSQYGTFYGENQFTGNDPLDLSTTSTKPVKLYYDRCYNNNVSYTPKCPEFASGFYIQAYFTWDTQASSCPSSHPYETTDGQCSDLPTSCQDMDTMTEACCEDYATGMCAAQGSELASWERTGMGYTQCSWECTQEPEEPEFDPETEEECEMAAQASCEGSGGMYNYFWDSEYDSCAFSCNDAPEDPIDPNAPPTPNPDDEPQCTLDANTGLYTGQCMNDEDPDNGECTENEDGTFAGQCIAGDGTSTGSLLKAANQHLLGIKGKIQGTNERLDKLPENIAKEFGLGSQSDMSGEWQKGFMSEFDKSEGEVNGIGAWLRGIFGLGEETGLDLVPEQGIDVTEQAGNFQGAIAGTGCPAPEIMGLSQGSFSIPYDSACEVAMSIRPVLIAIAWFVASFIIFAPARDE